MGMSHAGYFGIYLECSGAKSEETETGVMYCTNDGSHMFPSNSDTKFCGVCGSSVQRHKVMTQLQYIDIIEDNVLNMSDAELDVLESGLYPFGSEVFDYEYLIPTTGKVFGMEVDNDEEYALELDMSKGTFFPDLAKEWLTVELNILNTFYDKVEVKFGYLSRIST